MKKHNTGTRFLALLLCLIMVMGLVPETVQAADNQGAVGLGAGTLADSDLNDIEKVYQKFDEAAEKATDTPEYRAKQREFYGSGSTEARADVYDKNGNIVTPAKAASEHWSTDRIWDWALGQMYYEGKAGPYSFRLNENWWAGNDLAADYNNDGYVHVWKNTHVILDLNGHDIYRQIPRVLKTGYVIYVDSNSTFVIRDTSAGEPGGITGGHASKGGGIYIGGSNSTTTLESGEIRNNRGSGGGGVYMNGNDSTLFVMTGGAIKNNTTIVLHAADGSTSDYDSGGGIYVNEGALDLRGGHISNNLANYGGGLYLNDNPTNGVLKLTGSCELGANLGKVYGGGIYQNMGTMTIDGGRIIGNYTASGPGSRSGGGGIYAGYDGSVIGSCIITSNRGEKGGGIYVYADTLIDGAVITNNTAAQTGGGIYDEHDAPLFLTSCTITSNRAGQGGSGVYTCNNYGMVLGNVIGTSKKVVIAYNNSDNVFVVPYSSGSTYFSVIGALTQDSKIFFKLKNPQNGTLLSNACMDTSPDTKLFPQIDNTYVKIETGGILRLMTGSKPGEISPPLYNSSKLMYGTSSYASSFQQADVKTPFFYSDGYFIDDSGADLYYNATYNEHLASLSMVASLAARDSSATDDKAANIEKMLQDMGFTDIRAVGYENPDGLAYTMGYKKLENYRNKLVAVVIRDSGISKANIGAADDLAAYEKAVDAVNAAVRTYTKDHEISFNQGGTIWVTGDGDGGGVANLAARRMMDWAGQSSVWGYCFNAPTANKSYGTHAIGLFNINNANNPEIYFPMRGLGFNRPGTDKPSPSAASNTEAYDPARAAMLRQLGTMKGAPLFDDLFRVAAVDYTVLNTPRIQQTGDWATPAAWLEKLSADIQAWCIPNREIYVSKLQPAMIKFESVLGALTPQKRQTLLNRVMDVFSTLPKDKITELYKDAFPDWNKVSSLQKAVYTDYFARQFFDDKTSKSYIGDLLTAEQLTNLRAAFRPLWDMAMNFVSKDYSQNRQLHLGTLLLNRELLRQAGNPEIAFAWLRTADSSYKKLEGSPAAAINRTAIPKTPYFNLKEETVISDQTLIIYGTEGAEIYYTTDNSDPLTSSTAQRYQGEKIILSAAGAETRTFNVKAVQVKDKQVSEQGQLRIEIKTLYHELTYKGETTKHAQGSTVSLNAELPENKVFQRWKLMQGNLDVTYLLLGDQTTRPSASFTMPNGNVEVWMDSFDKISEVEVTFDKPTAGLNPTVAQWKVKADKKYYCSTGWPKDGTIYEGKFPPLPVVVSVRDTDVRTAAVTFIPSTAQRMAFSKNATAKINDEKVIPVLNGDGSLSVSREYAPVLTEAPKYDIPLEVDFGTPSAYIPLPENLPVMTTFGEKEVVISWTMSGYKPDTEGEYIFEGTLELFMEDIEAGEFSDQITATVTVLPQPDVSRPLPDIKPGVYREEQKIMLTATEGDKIYYTLDGSEPTVDSTEYSKPISITGKVGERTTVTVKAIAVRTINLAEALSTTAAYTYSIDIPKPVVVLTLISNTTGDKDEQSLSYTEGSAVTLQAPVRKDQLFVGWDVENSTGGIITESNKNDREITFNVPNAPFTLQANYVPMVSKIEVTMDVPTAGEDLPTTLSTCVASIAGKQETISVPKGDVTVTWMPEHTTATWMTEYSVDLTLKLDGRMPTSEMTLSINGVNLPAGDVVFDSESGNISVHHTFQKTATPKLKSVTQPPAVNSVPHGTTVAGLKDLLPKHISITLEDDTMYAVTPIWDESSLAGYDPEKPESQSFTVTGNAPIPAGIVDQNGVDTAIGVMVTVRGGQVAAVTSSISSGTYQEEQIAVLTSTTPDVAIYYTLDGSTPSTSGIPYTDPIALTGTLGARQSYTIKAVAVKEGMEIGPVTTLNYTIAIPTPEDAVITAPVGDQTITVMEGTSATLSVTAEKAESYQWEISSGESGWQEISDGIKADYATVTAAMEHNGTMYRCIVTGPVGSTPVISPIFTLSVTAKPQPKPEPKPEQPEDTDYQTVTATAGTGGSISPTGNVQVERGENKVFTITPSNGYRIVDVMVDGLSVGAVGSYTFQKVASNHTIAATFTKITGYSDVSENDWFFEDVQTITNAGLMNGIGDGRFDPKGTGTRGMIVTILHRQAGSPTVDTNEKEWYSIAQAWAMQQGISDGTNMTGIVTREQLVTLLHRYAKLTGVDVSIGENTNILSYDDAFDISGYAIPAFQWACGADITDGSDNKLSPGAPATRAEIAAIFVRFMKLTSK